MKVRTLTSLAALAALTTHGADYYWNGASNENSPANWSADAAGVKPSGSSFSFEKSAEYASNMFVGDAFKTPSVDMRLPVGGAPQYVGKLENSSKHAKAAMDIVMGFGGSNQPFSANRVWHFSSIVQDSESVAMKLRKGQGNSTFNVSAGTVSVLKNTLTFGGYGSQNLTELTVTGATELSGAGVFDVYADKAVFDGDVNIKDKAVLKIVKSVEGKGDATKPKSTDIKMKSLNIGSSGRAIMGGIADPYNIMGSVSIDRMSFSALNAENSSTLRALNDISIGLLAADSNNGKKALMNLRSDSGSIDIAKIELGKAANIELNAYRFPAKMEVGVLEFKTSEVSQSFLTVSNIASGGHFKVRGDLINGMAANAGDKMSIAYLRLEGGAIGGVIDNGAAHHALQIENTGAAKTTAVVSVGGITGGVGMEGNRITTTSNVASKGVELRIVGRASIPDGKYVFSGRLHDMPGNSAISPLSQIKEGRDRLCLTMDAAGYTQYLAGPVYIMGDTVVKNGTLFVTSAHPSQTKYSDGAGAVSVWGLNKLSLEGGAFGACGAGSGKDAAEAGGVCVRNMRWSGGKLLANVGAKKSDTVAVQEKFSLADKSGVYEIVLSVAEGALPAGPQRILRWSAAEHAYTKENFKVSFSGGKNYACALTVDQNGVSVQIAPAKASN